MHREQTSTESRSLPLRGRHVFHRPWAAALQALVLIAALLGPGCGSTGRDLEPEQRTLTAAPPAWEDADLSWDKLRDIEDWLASPDAAADPTRRVEAELQLAEGRLVFSERDIEAATAPSRSVALRLESARVGFDDLLDDDALSPTQRARAEVGRASAQALLGADRRTGLAIVPRSEWGARPAIPSRLTPLRGAWSRITVHHSAETSSTEAGGSLSESESTMRRIQEHHMERRNPRFGDIGYHYVIDSGGRIFEGRELIWQGAHAGGQQNFQNLGVCLLGNFEHERPTPAQMKSLELLLDDLRSQFRIPSSRVFSHRDMSTTVCPGDYASRWVEAYSQAKI